MSNDTAIPSATELERTLRYLDNNIRDGLTTGTVSTKIKEMKGKLHEIFFLQRMTGAEVAHLRPIFDSPMFFWGFLKAWKEVKQAGRTPDFIQQHLRNMATFDNTISAPTTQPPKSTTVQELPSKKLHMPSIQYGKVNNPDVTKRNETTQQDIIDSRRQSPRARAQSFQHAPNHEEHIPEVPSAQELQPFVWPKGHIPVLRVPLNPGREDVSNRGRRDTADEMSYRGRKSSSASNSEREMSPIDSTGHEEDEKPTSPDQQQPAGTTSRPQQVDAATADEDYAPRFSALEKGKHRAMSEDDDDNDLIARVDALTSKVVTATTTASTALSMVYDCNEACAQMEQSAIHGPNARLGDRVTRLEGKIDNIFEKLGHFEDKYADIMQVLRSIQSTVLPVTGQGIATLVDEEIQMELQDKGDSGPTAQLSAPSADYLGAGPISEDLEDCPVDTVIGPASSAPIPQTDGIVATSICATPNSADSTPDPIHPKVNQSERHAAEAWKIDLSSVRSAIVPSVQLIPPTPNNSQEQALYGTMMIVDGTPIEPIPVSVDSAIIHADTTSSNLFPASVRTASLAHREEVLDDHTTDSNFKKMLGITQVLCIRYADAISMVSQANSYFTELSADMAPETLNEWEDEIQSVEAMRTVDIKRMDIYGARMLHSLTDDAVDGTDTDTDTGTDTPVGNWLRLTIQVEEKQLELQDKVRRLGTASTEQDRQVVNQLRQVLTSMLGQVKLLQQEAEVPDIGNSTELVHFQDEAEFDDIADNDQDGQRGPDTSDEPTLPRATQSTSTAIFPEQQILSLPSNFNIPPSTAIWKPNVPGSSKIDLPWIWRTGRWHLLNDAVGAADTDRSNGPDVQQRFQTEFNCVHWLRARAQKNRWNEEIILVEYEMIWTVRYFAHRREEWAKASDMANINPGPKAYACRRSHIWHKFRAALLVIAVLPIEQQEWKQHFLCAEVELVLSFVGRASALGLSVTIPIIIWSLAASLVQIPYEHYPLKFSDNFQALLDAGVDKDSPVHLVDNYLNDWWHSENEVSMKYTLNSFIIKDALHTHATSGLREIMTDTLPRPPPMSVPTPPCDHCQNYLNLALELRENLMAMSTAAQAAHIHADTDSDLNMRRAAGFHQVHEAVVLKEQQTGDPAHGNEDSATRSASGPHRRATTMLYPDTIDNILITRRSRRMAMNAAEQFSDLLSLPISSQKWMWGAELTQTELKALANDPKSRNIPHSGYSQSLPDGRRRRQESSTNYVSSIESAAMSAIRADSGNNIHTHSIPDCLEPLPNVRTTTWSATESVMKHEDSVIAQSVSFNDSGSRPITEVSSVPNVQMSAPSLAFVSTAADAAAMWNLSSVSSDDVSDTTRHLPAQTAALWLEDSSDDESDNKAATHPHSTDADTLADAWAISSDDDLASDAPDSSINEPAMADAHIAMPAHRENERLVGVAEAAGVWSDSTDSDEDDILVPGNHLQRMSVPLNSFVSPVGVADAAAAWYSSDDDESATRFTGPSADRRSSPAKSLTHAVDADTAVHTVTPSRITLPRRPFSPSFFDFVDHTWLPVDENDMDPNSEGQSAGDDDAGDMFL
ncbi:hypothetical protein CVT25_009177 [Psilocybe cyanescens]|uniref:Uncharacterized protein n=1 Tax=Psilocybe cyanescens TaxID=93625 RepID=A0A409XQ33_PSICY|nr:hypothetical protein CVT25_009177 [Psilocybe cyanescens]